MFRMRRMGFAGGREQGKEDSRAKLAKSAKTCEDGSHTKARRREDTEKRALR